MIGFWWNSKFTWKSLIYSINVCVLFYTIFWLNLLKTKNYLSAPKADAFIFNRLVYFRLSVSFIWHCNYVLCSLFYRKDVREKLFNEMLELDHLLNYDQVVSKNRRSRIIFKFSTIIGFLFYYIISIAARFSTTQVNWPNFFYNLLVVSQTFILFLIHKYACIIIYLIQSRYEIAVSGNNRFNRRHLAKIQLKLIQIVSLFNESFGFILLMEITRNFVMLVSFVFFIFDDGFKYSGLTYFFAIFKRFLNNLPQTTVLSLVFHYSQNINDYVKNCSIAIKHLI